MEVHSNIHDKHIAFNSNFSQSIEDEPSALYEAITKNLNNYWCIEHHKQYEYFYEQRLLCEFCFHKAIASHNGTIASEQMQKYQYLYHLKSIMNHPLILLAKQQTFFQYPIQVIELMLKSYQPLIGRKSDLTAQKKLLNTFITRIKTRINSLCDSLMSNFERIQEHLTSINQYKDEMKHISKMYEQQFLELLGQRYTQGTKQELESVLKEYQIGNQNPFDKIFGNLDEVMSHLIQSPIINTQQLVNIYTTITDDRLWKINKIISTKEDSQQIENNQLMILNSEQIMLQDQYMLQMTQEGLILKKDEKQIGKLGIVFDSLYNLNKYRLIGVNYQSIQIISYFDRLKVEEVFEIQGCTDILSFDHDIIAISNESLMRIDIHSKKCNVLGNNFKELRYDSKSNWTFTCQNAQGKRVRWSLKQNDPSLQSIS